MNKDLKNEKEEITIFQATDLHYLSPSLNDNGKQFQETMRAGDGKLTEYSEEILDTLIKETLEKKPDALILSGDITFNGEKKSLQEVADKLEKVQAENIPVLVIPGNHDIDYPFAYQYDGDSVHHVDAISEKEFREIMGQFGYDKAVSRDTSSFSYLYQLSSDMCVMCLDANTEEDAGGLRKETLAWADKQLAKAKKEKKKVITVTHQNVLKQSDLLYEGFILSNAEETAAMLEKYDVSLNLSGHSHLMHRSVNNGLEDICMESISLYPLNYGVVQFDSDRNYTFHAQSLGILQKEAYERFHSTLQDQLNQQLADKKIPEADKEKMVSFAADANILYFCNDTDKLKTMFDEEGWKLWQKYAPDSFWTTYMNSMKDTF